MLKHLTTAVAVLAITGCASIQIPPEALERNQASIRSAEELGAAGVPAARLHLQMAKDQTAEAKRLAENGDESAVRKVARAQADAELALAMARESATRTDAERATEDLKALQSRGTN